MISEDFHQTPKRINRKNIFLLVIFILITAAVITSSFFFQKKTTYKSKASEPKNMQFVPQTFPDIDPQTGEFYDLWLNTSVLTVPNTGGGPTYLAQTTFTLGGPRLNSTTTLYGIKQSSEMPYAPDQLDFTYNAGEWGRFTATADLLFNNCIDLHTSIPATISNYIATMCYRNQNVGPSTHSTVYTPAANPFINLNYTGTEWSTIQTFSTAFNKYITKPEGYENGPLMTRVNWIIIDLQHSNINDFSNVIWTIQAITQGLTNQQMYLICSNPTNPQKYFKFTPEGSGPKPDGGSNFEVSDGGGCTYNLNTPSSSFINLGFVSLYMEGGVPLPPPDAKVFVTSTTYNGNLGGLTGADEKCQVRAQAAGLNGTYKTWLSDLNNDAIDRIDNNKYILVDGRVIAFHKTDLTDGVLSRAINKDEYGNTVNSTPTYVWSGTFANGVKTANNCSNWEVSSSSDNGDVGSLLNSNSYWSKAIYSLYNCSGSYRLYCFQVVADISPTPTSPPIPTSTPLPTPTRSLMPPYSCQVGQTRPYYILKNRQCVRINACGVSNCKYKDIQ